MAAVASAVGDSPLAESSLKNVSNADGSNGTKWKFSFLSLYQSYLKSWYSFHGLKEEQVEVDAYTSLHCWRPQSPGKHGKRPLLLLHGFGARALVQWDKQLGTFSKHFDLYIPDLVFFGESSTKGPERSVEFQATSCHQLMKHFGVPYFDVLGYSYGGSVAYSMALTFPAAVHKLVILASGILMGPDDFRKLENISGKMDTNAMEPKDVEGVRRLLKLAYYNPPWVPSFILKDVLQSMYGEPKPQLKELQAGFRKRMESFDPGEVPPVTQDTLIINGEFDPLFPVEVAERLEKHLQGKGKLLVISKTAHMPHAEKPTEVNTAVVNFLLEGRS